MLIHRDDDTATPYPFPDIDYASHTSECSTHPDDKCQHGEGSGVLLLPMAVLLVVAVVSFVVFVIK